MKFQTKFGIGEIVGTTEWHGGDIVNSELMKVIGIFHSLGGVAYLCRYPATGMVAQFHESELEGDQDFDQEAGAYPPRASEDE